MCISTIHSFSREQLFLTGLWYSNKKAPPSIVLNPLVNEFEVLGSIGNDFEAQMYTLYVNGH